MDAVASFDAGRRLVAGSKTGYGEVVGASYRPASRPAGLRVVVARLTYPARSAAYAGAGADVVG